MDLEIIWQEYGLDRLEEGIGTLFPENSFSLEILFTKIMSGDVFGAMAEAFTGSITDFVSQLSGMKNIFIWLLVLGIVSALMTHFVEIFDRHQVADLGFYFMYLLFTVILLQCFLRAASVAAETLENIILFIRLLMPAYLITIGVATGSITAGASSQLMLFVIYGIETVLAQGIVPLIYSFAMLVIVNGIWVEEKLSLLIELLEKGIGWVLKGALGIITGFSIFQSLVTPVMDSARKAGLQKLVAAIPGVGGAADGVVELVLGSAAVIKSSVGTVLLILLLLLCAAPLIKIGVIAGILKCAAAFMGIVSDKRITSCADRTGDAGVLLFRTVGTAMLLFLISVAVITASGGR